jgi:hypothetical protein
LGGEKRRRERKRCVQLGENEGGKNSDLKIGYVRLQLECVRTHISTFDRTHAECISEKCALRLNVKVDVRTHSCNNVCVWWGTAVEHTQVSSYTTPRLRSNVHDTFERRVHSKKKLFTK